MPNNLREFDSETLLEWELGIKSTLFENSLELSAAIFYDQRKDQQVKSSFVRPRQDGSTEFVDFLGNAAEGTNQGLELGVRWQILDSLSLTGNLALLNAEFDEFINEFGEDLSGRDQAQAPNNSFAVALNWQHQAWQANLSWIGKDEFYFSDRHNLKSTDYTLLNANISYALDKVTFRLWGRNLTDKDYTVRGFGSFGNDPRKGYITEPYVQFGEPKITGVTVEYKLGGSA